MNKNKVATNEELADRVRKRRRELNMTQEELAKKMGYSSRASINNIENGRPVTQKIIVKLANALQVNPVYLIGWDDDNEEFEFTAKEKDLIIRYRSSSEECKKTIDYILRK